MAQTPQTPIPWQQSTGMVGSYVSQALGYLAAIAAALLAFSAELPRWLVIVCAVVVALAGGGGVTVGVLNARARRAKGADPASPQPAILPAAPPGTGAVLVALLASGALLSLLLASCNPYVVRAECPPGSPGSARIIPHPSLPSPAGVVEARCGAVLVDRWVCDREARLVCDPNGPYIRCEDAAGVRHLTPEASACVAPGGTGGAP